MKFSKNLSYNNKILLGLSINLFLVILILYFFVFSYFNNVIEANALLLNHRIQFETKLIKEEKFSKISKNLTVIEKDVQKIDNTFVDENNKLEFITMLESLADTNAISISININFDKLTPLKKETPITLSLNGSYENLMNTLTQLENLKYYINIKNIDIGSSKNAVGRTAVLNKIDSNNDLGMNIQADIYWK